MMARDVMNLESDLSNQVVRTPVGSGAPPSALPDSYYLEQGAALSIDAASGGRANDSDPESDPMTAVLVTDVSSGTLVLNGDGAFNYIPDPGFTGIDSFSYQASDWNLVSGVATVTLNVYSNTDQGTFVPASATVNVQLVATGFTAPVFLTAPSGDPRLFVVEAGGKIFIVDHGSVLTDPFLDLSSDVSTSPDGGLLGLAFDPDYAQNGFFYVHRTAVSGDSVLSRFSVSPDPNVADAASEQVLLQLPQPFVGQNGGGIAFNPMDGFLYVGLGDGGSTGDPGNRAQDGNSLLGKILRLDVGVPPAAGSIVKGAYAIPADNPFVGDPGFLDEIWALGMRNPLHFSFDRDLSDLWLADEGQAAREEVNFEASDDLGGNNYGWDVMEGTSCNDDDPAPAAPSCGSVSHVLPIHDYPHTSGNCAITGGYVYRGAATEMVGEYFFADFCSGGVWSLDALTGDGTRWTEALGPAAGVPSQLVSFGEGGDGSLYILHLSGDIFGLGVGACDLEIDSDCDGIPDDGAPGDSPCATGQTEACDDNCPFAPNPGQNDTGGVGFGSAPDGIGNECQCGDVSGDGTLSSADSAIILRAQLVPPTAVMNRPDLCDVGDTAGCSGADSMILLRSQLNPATATVQQFCGPANP
jgi:glucose/arabinose dehydrogenase